MIPAGRAATTEPGEKDWTMSVWPSNVTDGAVVPKFVPEIVRVPGLALTSKETLEIED